MISKAKIISLKRPKKSLILLYTLYKNSELKYWPKMLCNPYVPSAIPSINLVFENSSTVFAGSKDL